jgi:hypothetical protein
MSDIITQSRKTVEELLARRSVSMTYEQRCQYAMDIVDIICMKRIPSASMSA